MYRERVSEIHIHAFIPMHIYKYTYAYIHTYIYMAESPWHSLGHFTGEINTICTQKYICKIPSAKQTRVFPLEPKQAIPTNQHKLTMTRSVEISQQYINIYIYWPLCTANKHILAYCLLQIACSSWHTILYIYNCVPYVYLHIYIYIHILIYVFI